MKKRMLFLDNCAGGTCIYASAALNACILVDLIVSVTHGDGAGRASIRASSASDAIRLDFECHGFSSLVLCFSLLNYNILFA